MYSLFRLWLKAETSSQGVQIISNVNSRARHASPSTPITMSRGHQVHFGVVLQTDFKLNTTKTSKLQLKEASRIPFFKAFHWFHAQMLTTFTAN